MAARIIQGISSSFVWLAANAVTADVASEGQRGRLFGSVTRDARGSIIGAFIGFTLVNTGEHMNGQVAGLGTCELIFLVYTTASTRRRPSLLGVACMKRTLARRDQHRLDRLYG